jgi:hypothetical protein
VINKPELAISAIVFLALAATAFAKDGGTPTLNIEYACHASAQAVAAEVSVAADVFMACMDDEKQARDELQKNWATYPAPDRAQCIQPKEYIPGYVEWLVCLEMTRDVKVMRKGQPAVTSSDIHECPVVRFLEDGTIISVKNC